MQIGELIDYTENQTKQRLGWLRLGQRLLETACNSVIWN